MAHLRTEIDHAIRRVIDSGTFIFGPELDSFEHEFAEYQEVSEVVGVSSGLAALKLMLQAFDVGPGDEVIVSAHTYIATWLAISHVGAKPVPVDPSYLTRNIDPSLLSRALSKRTKAVLAVHLYGVPCDMDSLELFCRNHKLFLLIDAAQSCGAKWAGERSKCLGDAAAFSFYPTKNLGALGDAGAIATNDRLRAERIRLLRNYGMRDRYHHLFKGDNAKLEEIHAATLRIKLRHLDDANSRRKQLVERYQKTLEKNPDIILQEVPSNASPAWHLFTLAVPERKRVKSSLEDAGIEVLIHYPVPAHLSPAYRNETGGWPKLPVTEELAQKIISLPLYSSMEVDTVDYISSVMNSII